MTPEDHPTDAGAGFGGGGDEPDADGDEEAAGAEAAARQARAGSGGPDPGRLAVVLVNYRTPDDTRAAAVALEDVADQVLVVENGSRDGSAEALRDWLPEGATDEPTEGGRLHRADDRALLVLPANRGFTGGNNAGVRVAVDLWDPHQVFLQNPDARVPPDLLDRGRRLLADGEAAMVSFAPAIHRNSLGARIRTAGRTPHQHEPLGDDLWRAPVASGMAQLMPRDLVDDLHEARGGVFREDLFIFFDELELGWLLHQWGREQVTIADPSVEHDVGESTATVDLPLKEYYNTRNIHLVARSMPPLNRLLVHVLSSGWALLELGVHLLRRDRPRIRAVFDGLRDGLAGRGGQWDLHARREAGDAP